jgi:hypothetical protein
MKFFILLLIAFFAISCASQKNAENTIQEPVVTPLQTHVKSKITGTIKDEYGESMFGAKVMLIQNGEIIQGVLSDMEGYFILKDVVSGFYDLEVNYVGYEPILKTKIEIKENTIVEFGMIQAEMPHVISLKPIIYLYPEKEMDISVELNYRGQLTHTYPKYKESGWKVKALPDGTLHDENGMEYYALFWEGKPTHPITPKDGFVISGKETTAFLEVKLAELGLNRREANEFIMFWLPQMENNSYNLIHFSSQAYEELAALKITPAPETIIRVMMIVKPLNSKIDFPLQDISKCVKQRRGFTAVEWGGSFWPTAVN